MGNDGCRPSKSTKAYEVTKKPLYSIPRIVSTFACDRDIHPRTFESTWPSPTPTSTRTTPSLLTDNPARDSSTAARLLPSARVARPRSHDERASFPRSRCLDLEDGTPL